MIEAYGTALVELKCKEAGGERVVLSMKMLRPQHVGALFAAVERYQVAELNLERNQLGALVAAALKTNTTLTRLRCAQLGRPSNQGQGLAVLLGGPTLAALALFTLPSPCAQARQQQPRPRGWHGSRRGPEEQYHPQGAPVCCPAIKPTRPCVEVLYSPPCLRVCHPLPLPLEASQHHPARASNATSHSLRVSRMSPARAQPTHSPHIDTQSTLLACRRANTLAAATHARATPRGPRPRPPLPTGGWRARVHPPACTCPSQAGTQRPRRRRRAGPQSGRPQRPQAEALASEWVSKGEQ